MSSVVLGRVGARRAEDRAAANVLVGHLMAWQKADMTRILPGHLLKEDFVGIAVEEGAKLVEGIGLDHPLVTVFDPENVDATIGCLDRDRTDDAIDTGCGTAANHESQTPKRGTDRHETNLEKRTTSTVQEEPAPLWHFIHQGESDE